MTTTAARSDNPADESVPAVPVGPDWPLRSANADREQHRGWDRFFPHGRPELGCGDEGQLRPTIDLDGQQLIPASWHPDWQRLRGGKVPALVPRLHRRFRGGHDRQPDDRCEIPEAG